MKNISNGRENVKVALEMVCDMLERLRVLERNIEHLLYLVHFLSEYYQAYYREKSKLGGVETELVYSRYIPALQLMRKDVITLQNFCQDLVDCLSERRSFFELKRSLFRKILYRGFDKPSDDDSLYSKFVILETLRDEMIGNPFDVLLILREEPEDKAVSYTISLGCLNTALAYLAHSIEQSMSGLFIGNLLEHQPTVYTHKDLYHAMYYTYQYSESYYQPLRKLFDKTLDTSEKSLFFHVSGIVLEEADKGDHKMEYTIVFGDSALPSLLDRYKLIALPIICAYRPRYWVTLAHEISHSFLHGVLLTTKIIERVLGSTIYSNESEKNKFSDSRGIKRAIEELLDYVAENFVSDPYFSHVFGDIGKRNYWAYLVGASEIVADLFAFLLAGYSYIPALVSNIVWGRSDYLSVSKLPYVFRISFVLEIARAFTHEWVGTLQNRMSEFLDTIDNMEVTKSICQRLISTLETNELLEFLDVYKSVFTDLLVPEKPRRFLYTDYFMTFGFDIGALVYKKYVKDLLHFILKEDINFGWIPKLKDHKPKEVGYVALNSLLNWKSIERFKKVCDTKTDDLVEIVSETLCHPIETMELYEYMKYIDYEVKQHECDSY